MKSVQMSFVTNTGKVSTYCRVIYVVLVCPTVSDEEEVPKYDISFLHVTDDNSVGTLNNLRILKAKSTSKPQGTHTICV